MFILALFALLFVVAQAQTVDNSSAFVRIINDKTSGSFQVQTTLGNYGTVLKVQATRVDLEADLLAVSVKPLATKALSFTGATGASFTSTAGDVNVSSNDRHILKIASTQVIDATPSNTTFTGFVHTKMVSAATGDLALRGALDVKVSAGTADDTKEFSFMYNGALGHTLKKDTVTSAGALSLASDKGDVSISTSGTAKTLSFESTNGSAKIVFASTGISIVGLQDATPTTSTDNMTASAGNKLVFSGENVNLVATAGDVVFGSEVTVAKTKSVSADGDLVLGAPTGKKIIFQNDAASTAFLDSTKLSLAAKAKLTGTAALSFSTGAAGNMVLQAGSAAAKTVVSADSVSAFTFTGGADGIQFNLPLTIPSTTGVTTFSGVTTVTGLATFEDSLTVGPSITGTGTTALTVEATNALKLHVKNAGGKLNVGTNVASLVVEPTGVTFDQAATLNGATKVGGPLDIKSTSVTVLAGKAISGAGALEFKSTGNLELIADNATAMVDMKVDGTSVAQVTKDKTTFVGAAGFTSGTGEADFKVALNAQGETEFKKDSTFTTVQGSPLDVSSSAALEIDSVTKTTIGNAAVTDAIDISSTEVKIGAVKTTFEKGIAPSDGVDLQSATVTALKGLSITSAAAGDFTLDSNATLSFKHAGADYLVVDDNIAVAPTYALNFAKKVTTTGDAKLGSKTAGWVAEGTVTLGGGSVKNATLFEIGTAASPITITATTATTGSVLVGSTADFIKVSSTGTEIKATTKALSLKADVTFSSTAAFKGGIEAKTAGVTFEGATVSNAAGTLKITNPAGALAIGSNSLDEMSFTTTGGDAKLTFWKDTGDVSFSKGDLLVTGGKAGIDFGGAVLLGLFGNEAKTAGVVKSKANEAILLATGASKGTADQGACWGQVQLTGNYATSCIIATKALKVILLNTVDLDIAKDVVVNTIHADF